MSILVLITIGSVTANYNHIEIDLMLSVPFEEFFDILETEVDISYEEDVEFMFHFCKRKDIEKSKDKNIKYISF